MAPPVSVKTGPLDDGHAWEGTPEYTRVELDPAQRKVVRCCSGTYCPAGRSEGRATLMRGKASAPYFFKRALTRTCRLQVLQVLEKPRRGRFMWLPQGQAGQDCGRRGLLAQHQVGKAPKTSR